jgi:hypothetical protein
MMEWKIFEPRQLAARADLPGVDAQLVWADGTQFAHFQRPGCKGASLPELIPLLVELASGVDVSDFAAVAARRHGHVPQPNAGLDGLGYCTARLTPEHLKDLLADPQKNQVRRVELQMPVIPQRPKPEPSATRGTVPASSMRKAAARAICDSEVLLGVIDSACPFAHPHFRHRGSTQDKPKTRILNLWVQDGSALSDRTLCEGRVPVDFGYGHEAGRDALDQVMRRSTRQGGPVDESACYERTGGQAMRHRFTHGSAVLDLFASPVALRERMHRTPDTPPTWHEDTQAAATADIVFVQLPQDTVQDSSSASLARHLLDGLQYIVSCASSKTRRIVVNISDGSSRGSHDGDSLFERAVAALLDAEPRLRVVIGAGNGFNAARHAQIDTLAQKKCKRLTLRLPPGCESPAFVFLRMPASAASARIRVAPQGGAVPGAWVKRGEAAACYLSSHAAAPVCTVIHPPPPAGAQAAMAMVAWSPTQSVDTPVAKAPSGNWEIEIDTGDVVQEPIHLYIARNQTNPGALPRGRQAQFIDPKRLDDPQRHLDPLEDDPQEPASFVRRHGTLSGLASFTHEHLTVVGSTLFREGTPGLYSSDGPAAGALPGNEVRQVPDAWAPADTHRALPGVRALGGVAGTVVRVSGTSFAVPQVARAIANSQAPLRDPKSPRRRSRLR